MIWTILFCQSKLISNGYKTLMDYFKTNIKLFF